MKSESFNLKDFFVNFAIPRTSEGSKLYVLLSISFLTLAPSSPKSPFYVVVFSSEYINTISFGFNSTFSILSDADMHDVNSSVINIESSSNAIFFLLCQLNHPYILVFFW